MLYISKLEYAYWAVSFHLYKSSSVFESQSKHMYSHICSALFKNLFKPIDLTQLVVHSCFCCFCAHDFNKSFSHIIAYQQASFILHT